jgi:DNA ligase (NAD+)
MPTHCPSCGTELVREAEQAVWFCPNSGGCPAQAIRLLEHFASRGAMDIEGLGERMAYTLFEQGLVANAADVYDLTVEQLTQIDRMGQKSAENLVSGIERSKSRPLLNVIFALGIRHVGYETARLLAQHFGSLPAILDAGEEALQEVEGIGPVVAKSIADWAEVEANRAVVAKLAAADVTMEQEIVATEAGPLEGLTLVVTGTLESMSRNEAEDRIREMGGKVGSSVTKKTDALIAGTSAGSKLQKAEKLGVRVIDEALFTRLLTEGADVLREEVPA